MDLVLVWRDKVDPYFSTEKSMLVPLARLPLELCNALDRLDLELHRSAMRFLANVVLARYIALARNVPGMQRYFKSLVFRRSRRIIRYLQRVKPASGSVGALP